jgi:predicted ATP-dependent serine protease
MSATQGTWTCSECGAWNAEWINKCGKCKAEKND